MAVKAPEIDSRSAADIAGQVKELLSVYAPEWKEFDPATGKPVGMSAALINIFARYCEIVIQRLNQTPEKNFLAFLDLLGASLQPPQPARVPLTFTLAAGRTDAAVVPARTQAAAPPAEGEKDPVIFETERELTVTPARLAAIFTRDPATDRYADRSAIIDASSASGVPVFESDRQMEHVLYLGSSGVLGIEALTALTVSFTLSSAVPNADARELRWEFWDGTAWRERIPVSDGTQRLTQSGIVIFNDVMQPPLSTVNKQESRWMRCRLLTPVHREEGYKTGMVRASHLPAITLITLQGSTADSGLRPEQAFSNQQALDLTKSFFPFGEKPRFEDALYLACGGACSHPGAQVTVTTVMVNPAGATGTPLPPVNASEDLEVAWEYWDGSAWAELGAAKAGQDVVTGDPLDPDFKDTTQAFTKSGVTILTLAGTPAKHRVNGVESYWVRARIISGNYGEEAYYTPSTTTEGYVLNPDTFTPPSIRSVSVAFVAETPARVPETVLLFNDFVYENAATMLPGASGALRPFTAGEDALPALYFGLELPAGTRSFPNRPLSFYASIVEDKYGEAEPAAISGERLEVAWEYWNGGAWSRLAAKDASENFTRPGAVELLPPADFSACGRFARDAYWLRALWKAGAYDVAPRMKRILLNTTMAVQATTRAQEIIGSSDQSEGQRFKTAHKPVLSGQQLEVREPEAPSSDEQAVLRREEGENAVTIVPGAAGKPKEIWVRWHETPDFYASGPRDRHYVLDHLTGEISFGDGLSGMIPPRGVGNIRMKRYQFGGGVRGNRGEGAIVQLKTTVPYIEKVVNREAASGGAEAETLDLLYERAPRMIRHRNRAVTVEDYADVAMLASPEVARARCVPLRNLAADALGGALEPGVVSVIVVPRTRDAKPLPTLELINRVESFLRERLVPTASVAVVGPLYMRVNVAAEIALVALEGAGAVEQAVRDRLDAFLHPLTGGMDGRGWDFGREPYQSDFYALIERVPGVDHIRSLTLTLVEEQAGVKATGRFLVYSGSHAIKLVFEAN